MDPVVAIDGQLCEPDAAKVSIFDRGFLYGDGVFTVLRGRGDRAVDLGGHLEQLAADAGMLDLRLPSLQDLAVTVAAVLEKLAAPRARVRIVVSRGPGGLAARWSELGSRVIIVAEAEALPPRTEVRAIVIDEPRLLPSARWAPKSLSYQPALWARERAAAAGADEALRLFSNDTVGEGAASNLFAIFSHPGGSRDQRMLVTPPPLGIRPGVTRRRILELCAGEAGLGVDLGFVVVECPLAREELRRADELFVTSSIAGVVPITSLDGEARSAGPVTMRLRLGYEQWLERLAAV